MNKTYLEQQVITYCANLESDCLTRGWVKRLKSLFGKDYGVIIQIVEKNFRRVTEKQNPVPVAVAGLEADIECRKVLDVGNSKGLSFKEAWLTLTSHKEYVKQQLVTDEKGENYCILLTKPSDDELPKKEGQL